MIGEEHQTICAIDMFSSTSRRVCQETVHRAKSHCSEKFDAVLRDLPPAKNISRSSWNPSIRLADHLQPLSEIQVNEVVEATQSEAIVLFSSLALGPFLEPSQERLQQLISEEVAKFRAASSTSDLSLSLYFLPLLINSHRQSWGHVWNFQAPSEMCLHPSVCCVDPLAVLQLFVDLRDVHWNIPPYQLIYHLSNASS
jgi:hypothetical protein